ncbi:MAG: 5-(carboxyamino)imidazole ribonucleotide mutase [Bacillota bacterium]
MIHPLVGIVMGSDSDLNVMKDAASLLSELSIPHEVIISSAHRAPERTMQYAANAANKGLKVIIAGAGSAAHLAGVIASHTTLPVIGVPIYSGALKGLDALYATVQMPPGVPVATVAINGARNAGILAAQILAVSDPDIHSKIKSLKTKMAEQVCQKSTDLERLGIDGYIAAKLKI